MEMDSRALKPVFKKGFLGMGVVLRGGAIGQFGKYHNTLFLSPQILHRHCFCFLLRPLYVPRETGTMLMLNFGGQTEYYGIFRSGL